MEGVPEIPKHEMGPRNDSYMEAGVTFKNQLALFESVHAPESFKTPSDAIYGFASFIRTQSEKVLESVRTSQTGLPEKQKDEYRLEEATAKLHELNLANAATLHLYAEVRALSEAGAGLQREIFPWLRSIDAWASQYVQASGTNE